MESILGKLQYDQPGGLSETELIGIIVGVALVFVIIAIVIIILLVCLKRTRSKKRREYERLMKQLAALESSVRDQCRQGLVHEML